MTNKPKIPKSLEKNLKYRLISRNNIKRKLAKHQLCMEGMTNLISLRKPTMKYSIHMTTSKDLDLLLNYVLKIIKHLVQSLAAIPNSKLAGVEAKLRNGFKTINK